MFEQVIASGANLFFIILALLIGFINALAYVDYVKVRKEQDQEHKGKH